MIEDDIDSATKTIAGMGLSAVARSLSLTDYSGGDIVVKIQPEPGGAERMLTFRRPPSSSEARLLHAILEEKRGGIWATFVLMVYAAAIRSTGLFAVGSAKATRGSRGKSHVIALSPEVLEAIEKDTDMWEAAVRLNEPMITKPQDGQYLTVKSRAVTHRRGLRKAKTIGEGSWQWDVTCRALGETAWRVNRDVLGAIGIPYPDDPDSRRMRGQLSRIGDRPFYMPPYMDFRGRSYYRTAPVTYQGTDYQKALLMFDPVPFKREDISPAHKVLVDVNVSNMMGKPYDKGDLIERAAAVSGLQGKLHRVLIGNSDLWDPTAEEPYQLYAWLISHYSGHSPTSALPICMDGTCNGLQHLSAMFLDERGGEATNLLACNPMTEGPQDVYDKVARRFSEILRGMEGQEEANSVRRVLHTFVIDRKSVKRAVMTLPYGATTMSMADFVKEALLEQKPSSAPWTQCLDWDLERHVWVADKRVQDGSYQAFANRELKDHPLFNLDIKVCAGILVQAIKDMLPKAMAAMDTLRGIGRWAAHNNRLLSWEVGPQATSSTNLRVVQSQSAMHTNKVRLSKLVLPRGVRSLSMPAMSDEMSNSYNSTGIVPNFIHSQDARHLHQTARSMYEQGCRSFAAIHDCFATSLPWAPALKVTVQEEFASMYGGRTEDHPLSRHVYTVDPATGRIDRSYPSWFHLAEVAGVPFPEQGSLKPSDITNGKAFWFFS